MRRNRPVLLLTVVVACAGCAPHSYTIDDPSGTTELRIRVGDEIRVVTTDRERISLRVNEIQEDRFTGVTVEPDRKETLPTDISLDVPYAKIAMIEVTRFDPNVAAAAGGAAVFTVALGTLVLTGVPIIVPPP